MTRANSRVGERVAEARSSLLRGAGVALACRIYGVRATRSASPNIALYIATVHPY
jgi:hypothetical protein